MPSPTTCAGPKVWLAASSHPWACCCLTGWLVDDGSTGDKYDAGLLEMVTEANNLRLEPAQLQAIVDRLEELDPEGFRQVAVNNPDGPDALLVQFQALRGDQERAGRMVDDIYGLWFGD